MAHHVRPEIVESAGLQRARSDHARDTEGGHTVDRKVIEGIIHAVFILRVRAAKMMDAGVESDHVRDLWRLAEELNMLALAIEAEG